ncbi:hypothetical protein H8N03_04125 [Ramlibacter sp. USB13]|uniref:DUF5666 domain-containing protein n=1 Tax=Ramlibacter cellulosilyticus TaxID=2764187 RepID=A0A923MQ21_9BURK|nr:hypothetical protein [Ramlibacter cellulosilyticus]
MPFPSRSCLAAALALAAAFPASAAPGSASEQVSARGTGVAAVGGLWCGAGLLHEFTLEIAQQYANVQGRLVRKQRVREITGKVEGTRVKVDPQRDHTMELQASGDELRIVSASGMLALATGQSFTRATGSSCKG